jgi:molybdopterin molybdotransferase
MKAGHDGGGMMAKSGFTERMSLDEAWAWLDARPQLTDVETIPLDRAFGRVLAVSLTFSEDRPDRDRIVADGYAVRSESTMGASGYNPLFLTVVPKSGPLAKEAASLCHAGDPVPSNANAVLPLDAGEVVGSILEICAPVARGQDIGRKGLAAKQGDVAIPRGRRLGGPEIALAALLGTQALPLLRRPEIAVVLAGPKPPAVDALATALSALIARDGGVARVLLAGDAGMVESLRASLGADLLLVVGRSGWGDDDEAARAIEDAGGRLDHHGLALRPGGTVGCGGLGAASLLLLPGDPLAALVTYDLLAGRLIRRLAGHAVELPYSVRRFPLLRKIASPIGVSEWVPVRRIASGIEPLALSQADGLAGVGQIYGFLVVPAGLEGYAPGESIEIYVTAEGSTPEERP